MKVMVIDDDRDIVMLLSAVLATAGHEVVSATGGARALELLDGEAPDVIILDVQMADLDGWETLERIRAHERAGEVPVLMCTVKSSPSDRIMGWELGCDGYLPKPFDITRLVEEVEEVAGRSADQREVVRSEQLQAARNLESTQLRAND